MERERQEMLGRTSGADTQFHRMFGGGDTQRPTIIDITAESHVDPDALAHGMALALR
jgi:hypothetical protein